MLISEKKNTDIAVLSLGLNNSLHHHFILDYIVAQLYRCINLYYKSLYRTLYLAQNNYVINGSF